MKKVFVKFDKNGPRILVNPANEAELLKDPNVLFNPDMTQVMKTPIQNWVQKDGKIVPSIMFKVRKSMRIDDISPRISKLKKIIYLTNISWFLVLLTTYLINK